MDSHLTGIKAIFLDLDGTIYLGEKLINGALEFLERCTQKEIQYFFLSNNSSRSVDGYLSKLHNLGIPAEKNEILLSTHDLLFWLSDNEVSETYLVGTEEMRKMLEDSGINTRSEKPQYVVLGYDTEINYEKLTKSTIHLHNGVPLVASHPDIVCPSPDGGLPDVGAYLSLFEATCGVKASQVCGKPNAGMINHKIEELGLQPSECAMVGDRLYTDIEMANRVGCLSILVLSGESTKNDVDKAPQEVNLVVNSVANLL